MPSAALEAESTCHPWLVEIERAPVAAFSDLLAGYARIHPYQRADAPDAARMLFGPLPPDDPARRALGQAILGWLAERRREPLPADPHRLQRRVREICEAFEIVSLLDVADAAVELRRRFILLNDWVARLALSPSRDARAEYWRMLALTQSLVADAVEPHGLAPFWLKLCAESGGPLPERYLTIGLLGLRRLPGRALDGLEAPWLAGLAHWALARGPSPQAFLAEWRPLKQLYPKVPKQWRRLVSGLLTSRLFKEMGIQPPAWWGGDPDFAPLASEAGSAFIMPVPKEEREEVVAAICQGLPLNVLRPKIEKLTAKHRRYAERTGDSYFLVRTFTNVGMQLLRQAPAHPTERARLAQALAREALRWEPRNAFAWSLWRDALEAEGAMEAAELVGWEFVRRVPDDPQPRNLLADLLARQPARRGEAEAVYRETARRFPEDAYTRNQLAELLIAQGRLDEAEAVIIDAVAAGAANAVTYAIQARLRSHAGDVAGAMEAVSAGLAVDDGDVVLRQFRDQLSAGRRLRLVSSAFYHAEPPTHAMAAPADVAASDVLTLGQARRLRFRLGSEDRSLRESARAEVEAWLREEPAFAYAGLLAARNGVWAPEADTLPPVAVAFEAALAARDRTRLDQLTELMPRLEALILVARAVLGDAEAVQWVEHWLRAGPSRGEEPAVAALRTLMRPVLRLIEGGRPAAEVIVESHSAIVAALHDANEATLGNVLLAA